MWNMNGLCVYNFARRGHSPREEMFTKDDFDSPKKKIICDDIFLNRKMTTPFYEL